jgi:pyruvate dehydrogenase E2 component (dihydrolipoamide acetyltransferase)
MMTDFVMPKLGSDMTAGTLAAWFKHPGDAVKRGDIVAEVETEKGAIDVEIFADGVIEQLLIQPGEKVPVGTPLAKVRESGAPVQPVKPSPGEIPTDAPVSPPSLETRGAESHGRVRITPSARQLAHTLGIDTNTITGTGPDKAITREDVEKAAKLKPSTLRDRSRQLRQTIAAAMARAKREIPHYYLSTTINLHRALTWMAEENLKQPVTERFLPGVLFLKAASLALRTVPELNATWDGERVVPSKSVHLGVAISLRQGGLIAPAIHDADQLSLKDLMAHFLDLVSRARSGSLRSSELSDPTITVTSLGEQGVESVFPIIYLPQVAIVGFGKVVERPWVVEGQILVRPVVTATLAADHRVSDGHRGGLFLAAIDRLLQEPEKL